VTDRTIPTALADPERDGIAPFGTPTGERRAKIRNRNQLLAEGESESRRIVLDVTERVLQRLDAYQRIRSIAHLDGDLLTIGTRKWDLSRKRHVYLIGAGKACNAMAMAIEDVLGDRLTAGIAIVKVAEDTDTLTRTRVVVGGHPLPTEAGLHASLDILALVDQAGPDDLFIAVISGGSSALMSCPIDGITLQDEQAATDILLKSGAGIYEINAVRRHISQTNGGRLAQRIAGRGAELIGIGISDAIGNPPTRDIRVPHDKYSSTPIGPDTTTLDDARRTIAAYGLADRLPERVVTFLRDAGPEHETPKAFPQNTYFLLNTVADSAGYARDAAAELGVTAYVLTTFLEGESKDAGTFLASLAREIQSTGRPFTPPCLIISAGETTTLIDDNAVITGHGGPSHELTIGFALTASSAPGACMLSIDSEGTDGTTRAAGGITDSSTRTRAEKAGVDLRAALRGHASHEALSAVGDVVVTGNTGTNLCDFNLLYVPAPTPPTSAGGGS
jgi:glycerate-2-kinase